MYNLHQLHVWLIAAWLIASPLAAAQSQTEHSGRHGAAAEAIDAELASGEVRRIDKEQQKITLRHGQIKSLDMPPMSMIFRVRESGVLDTFKVGDKVLFSVIKDSDGSYVVTTIKPAP